MAWLDGILSDTILFDTLVTLLTIVSDAYLDIPSLN